MKDSKKRSEILYDNLYAKNVKKKSSNNFLTRFSLFVILFVVFYLIISIPSVDSFFRSFFSSKASSASYHDIKVDVYMKRTVGSIMVITVPNRDIYIDLNSASFRYGDIPTSFISLKCSGEYIDSSVLVHSGCSFN